MATVNIKLNDIYGILCVFYESYKLNITGYTFYFIFLSKILSKLKQIQLRFQI